MGGVINTITAGTIKYKLASTAYAICSTAAGTTEKQAIIYDPTATSTATQFSLMDGVTVQVLFQNTNTATSPTLNINSTGAIPIYTTANTSAGNTASTSWSANSIISLTCTNRTNYNGYVWLINSSNGRISAINNNTDKLYLLGTPSQDNSTIYSKQYIYAGTDGYLYSNNHKVVTEDEIGTAAYTNVDTEIDTSIISNNVPTSGAVVNLVSNGLTNVKQQIESDAQLENTQYGVLLSNSYEDETNIGSVIKSDKLKYDFNQSTLYLSNIDENNPSDNQVFSLKPNELTFQSGVVTQVQIPSEEEGEDPTVEQNYDNYNSTTQININGILLREKVENNGSYQFVETNIASDSTALGGTLSVSGNTNLQGTLNVVGNTVLNNQLTVQGTTAFLGSQNRFQSGTYDVLIGTYTSPKNDVTYSGFGFGLSSSTARWLDAIEFNKVTMRRYNANYINRPQAELYVNFTNDNQSLRITRFSTDNDFQQKSLQTVLTPSYLYMRGDYETKTSAQDSSTYQKQVRIAYNNIYFRENNANKAIINATKVLNWDTFASIKSSWSTYTNSSTTVSIAANAYGICSQTKTLTPGTWLLHGGCSFPARSSGFIGLGFSNSNATNSGGFYNGLYQNKLCFSGETNYITVSGLMHVSSNTTVYLKATTSVAANCIFRAFKAIQLAQD